MTARPDRPTGPACAEVAPDDAATAYTEVADPDTGAVRLLTAPCATCIFGNQMDLQPGRLAQMTADTRAHEGHIPCHETLDGPAPAICRGFADGTGRGASLALRPAHALGTLTEVPPPTPPHSPK